MIKNYISTAWRNIKKHRVFSFINVAGLTVGLAAFWLITLYIADEVSYDQYNTNANRIYRVVHYATWNGGSFSLAPTAPPYGPALKADYPDVEAFTRFDPEGGGTITVGDKNIKANDILFTDNAVFSIFSYHFLQGNAKAALTEPQSIVLTKTMAVKLFGSADAAMNKQVFFDKSFPNKVTGVIDDVPANSQFSFSALRSYPANFTDGWNNSYVFTYIMLRNGADHKKLEAQLGGFYNKYLKQSLGNVNSYRMELQPLTSIHLHSNLQYEMGANGDIKYIYIFSIIAVLVLVIAVINYVNLSTARSSVRVKEIGVRKVVGSGKKHLVAMFLAESLVLTLVAAAMAAAITYAVLPYFNQFTGKSLSVWQFGVLNTFTILVLFSLLTGILSGIYPAFFLANFKAIPALKGEMGRQGSSIFFRKALVTFQFVVTVVLIAGSAIIYQQLHFAINKDLGLNKKQVLSFHVGKNVRPQLPAVKQALLQNPLIEGVSAASNPIGNNDIGSNGFYFEQESNREGVQGEISKSSLMAQSFMVDEDYLPTLQIKLAEGRNFSPKMPADTFGSVMVNETVVKQMGWKNAIGKKMQYGNGKQATVVGVVKDFNIFSIQHKIEPLVMRMPPVAREEDNLYIRVSKNNIPAALQYLKDTYKKFDAENAIEYTFLDENFAKQYRAEQKQGSIILVFTILAISIACLGLLGLVTFAASQRTKEIGVRKVLGASITSIVVLLSKDFIKLVAIAFVIAVPVAWYAMGSWLQTFAYRINIGWGVFAMAGGLAIIIALITVGYQAIKSATANPVRAIKTE